MTYVRLDDEAMVEEDAKMGSRARTAIQIILDVFLFFSVAVPIFVVDRLVGPFHRGFFCDDETIRRPYLGDTVSTSSLFIFGLALPIVSIIIIEFIYLRTRVQNGYVRRCLGSGTKLVGVFLYGYLVTLLLTEVGKLTVGRLRPHFIDTCKPNFTNINCSLGYITEFECTNTEVSDERIEDARKSFPSGHASLAAYTGFFLVYYFHFRVTTTISIMLKFVMQSIVAGAAMFCGLSRVMNNRHHPEDVLAGMILGVIVAFWTFLAVGNKYLGITLLPVRASPVDFRKLDDEDEYPAMPVPLVQTGTHQAHTRNSRPLAYDHD